jgi:DNA-binding NtrC family response regulator
MRLLLVEDKDSFRRLLVQALAGSPWEVTAVADPAAALAALAGTDAGEPPFAVLVTDLRLPGMSGLELLKAARRRHPAMRALLMSAFGEPRDIVEAMRWGADDFLPKPFDLDQFAAVLERLRALVAAPPPDPAEPWIVHSPAMRELDRALGKAAETGFPVLFSGAPGTGKGRAARRLHALRQPQAPYLCLSAPSLGADGLAERDLALLQGGSLLVTGLDELAPASAEALARAMAGPLGQGLHWLGSCRDPEALPQALRLRLGVIALHLPPLSERREDILPMFRNFLRERARQDGKPVPMLAAGVEKELLQAAWPGNLGQLAWVVATAWRATTGPLLAPLALGAPAAGGELALPWPGPGPLAAQLAKVTLAATAPLLRRALADSHGDPAAAAQALGLAPRAFAQALREHHISLETD